MYHAKDQISGVRLRGADDLFHGAGHGAYNTGLRTGELTNAALPLALHEMTFMFPICFVMGFCFIDRLAPKIAFRMVTPGVDNPLLVTLVRASVTVAFMCPIMSFWATLIFKQAGVQFIAVWLQTVACNFPMAFFWQIFYCGPLVRWLFRTIFRVGRAPAAPAVQTHSQPRAPKQEHI